MFRVEWIQAALDELMNIWMQADAESREAITVDAEAIDRELRADPFRQTESSENDERVLFIEPLAVQIEVELTPRRVWVLHVWRYRGRHR